MNIKTSATFKKDLSKSIAAIILFIVVYFLLLFMGIGLAAGCLYAGIAIIALKPMIWTLLIGFGIIGLGVLVFFFLVKFLFSRNKIDTSGMVEIHPSAEPKLFELVYGIAEKVGTDRPKKIFINAEVNASVFYNSSFWSMVLPVRKNLQIGLGLINAVTESELEAILAHEFGHFSQKSMKVGSYVYQANRIIFNMLFEDSFYNSILSGWSNIHGIFALFTSIALRIIQAVQWVLKQVYIILNKAYMGLSRQMEFQADEIAAHVAGSKPLIDSLLRLEIAETSYQSVLNFYGEEIQFNKKTANLYPEHRYVMNYIAAQNDISLLNNLPNITLETQQQFNKSKLIFDNQWASHPSTEDRIAKLQELNISKPVINTSAWNLLSHETNLQKDLTEKLFKEVIFEEGPSILPLEGFIEKYEKRNIEFVLPEIYAGFYDEREISEVDKNSISSIPASSVKEIFSQEAIDICKEYKWLKQDIETIEQIANGDTGIKTFDYDGIKYAKKETGDLLADLNEKLKEIGHKLETIDAKGVQFFYSKSTLPGQRDTLDDKYKRYYEKSSAFKSDIEIYSTIHQGLTFIQFTTAIEDIRRNFYQLDEPFMKFKNRLRALVNETNIEELFSTSQQKDIQYYLKSNLTYFRNDRYDDENLKTLFSCLQCFLTITNRTMLMSKKDLLNFQQSLL